MNKNDLNYNDHSKNISEEKFLTNENNEFLAIAYAAAKAREVLGAIPEKAVVEVSGDIIKNTESVVTANLSNCRGIEAAIAAGIIVGKSEKKLEVVSDATEEDKKKINEYIENFFIEVKKAETPFIFDIQVNLFYRDSSVKIRIVNDSTNIILIEKDGDILYIKEAGDYNKIINMNTTIADEDYVDMGDIKGIIGRKN